MVLTLHLSFPFIYSSSLLLIFLAPQDLLPSISIVYIYIYMGQPNRRPFSFVYRYLFEYVTRDQNYAEILCQPVKSE